MHRRRRLNKQQSGRRLFLLGPKQAKRHVQRVGGCFRLLVLVVAVVLAHVCRPPEVLFKLQVITRKADQRPVPEGRVAGRRRRRRGREKFNQSRDIGDDFWPPPVRSCPGNWPTRPTRPVRPVRPARPGVPLRAGPEVFGGAGDSDSISRSAASKTRRRPSTRLIGRSAGGLRVLSWCSLVEFAQNWPAGSEVSPTLRVYSAMRPN